MTNPVRLRNDPDPIQQWTVDQVRKWRALRRPWSAIGRDLKISEASARDLYGWVEGPDLGPSPPPVVVAKPKPSGGLRRPLDVVREKREAAERYLQMPTRIRSRALAVAERVITREKLKIRREVDRFSYVRALAAAGYAAMTGAHKTKIGDAFGVHGGQLSTVKLEERGLTAAMVAEVCAALKASVARGGA